MGARCPQSAPARCVPPDSSQTANLAVVAVEVVCITSSLSLSMYCLVSYSVYHGIKASVSISLRSQFRACRLSYDAAYET